MASGFLGLSFALLALHESAQGAATYSQVMSAANKTALNEFNPAMAKAMAALAKLAYCGVGPSSSVPYGTEGGIKQAAHHSCGTFCESAGFKMGKMELVSAKDKGTKNAVFAFVAQLKLVGNTTAPADCVVSIRGTWVNPANQDRDHESTLVDWPMPSCKNKTCQVHSGANAIWGEIKGGIVDSLKGLHCSSVVVTGHSLGAQLAALAMFSLQDEYGFKVGLSYTFEGPVPFNAAATAVFDGGLFGRPISLFRITHTSDKVVMFPSKAGYMQPGSQVWFYGPNAKDFVHCGTVKQAPKCGINGLPSNTLCSITKNDAWKKCGGVAPYGGPHCSNPLAPAQNFCDMAGDSRSNFIAASSLTCQWGHALNAKAQAPTISPQVFPITVQTTQGTTGEPTTTTVNEFAGPSYSDETPSCWTKNKAYVPLGMINSLGAVRPSMQSCQEFCSGLPYCEYVSWWPQPSGTGGWCHPSGAWAHQMPMLGATSGPKTCAIPLAEETSVPRCVNLELEFLQSLTAGSPSNPFVRFNERGFGPAGKTNGLSVGGFVVFGLAMMLAGSVCTLLLTRAFSRRSWALRQASLGLSSSMERAGVEDGLE